MKRWARRVLLILGLAAQLPVLAATVPPELLAVARACSGAELALTHDPIEVPVAGTAGLDFSAVLAVLSGDSVLEDLQAAYAATLPPGTKAEFTVRRQGPNSFFYINRDGQRAEVTELARHCRGTEPERTLEVDFYVTTVRFLGPFHAVLRVVIREGAPGVVAYDLNVYVYPERSAVRFLGRRLGLVQSFFRSKSEELVNLVARLFSDLCARQGTEVKRNGDGLACPAVQSRDGEAEGAQKL